MQSIDKLQILIVDDVEINREIFAELLGDQYAPLYAANGLEAVAQIQEYSDKIALILLDVMMPEMDGYGVLQKMQEMNLIGVIPVIIISALEDQEAIDRAYEMGATDFLSRGADRATLNKRISNYIHLFGRQKTSLQEISTQAEELASQNYRLETLDDLTGCNNRVTFRREAQTILRENPQRQYALWYCDIKQFNIIKARFGYDVGDYVIKYWAKRIGQLLQDGETYCRLSDDRFALLTHYDGTDFLSSRFQRMAGEVHGCLTKIDLDHDVEICAGIYLIRSGNPEDLTVNMMLDRAALAQQTMKRSSGSSVCLYDSKMLENQLRRAEISKHLATALQNGEVMAYFQPQFDFTQRAVVGAETLCRWKHSSLGWLSPAEFIPVLEQSNQIYQMDCFIWREACRALATLRSKGIPMPISVNVSRADIREESLIKNLTGYLDEFHLSPKDLHLEVTESAYMDDAKQLMQVVQALQSMGFTIEMDDFGSGYSSMNTLKDLPVNMLKLDTYFIRQAISGPRGRVILSTVIDMAQRLRLPLIAEGIETLEQAQNLMDMGCKLMQGYYFARPMPMAEFLEMLDTTPVVLAKESVENLQQQWSAQEQSADLLRRIVRASCFGVFAYSLPERKVLLVNREAYLLMGVEEREICPNLNPYPRLLERIVPADLATVVRACMALTEVGSSATATYRLRKDGKVYRTVRLTAQRLQSPSGGEMIVSNLSDETQQGWAEDILNKSLEAYQPGSPDAEADGSVFTYCLDTHGIQVESTEFPFSRNPETLRVPEDLADGETVAPESRQEYLAMYQKILEGAPSASAVLNRVRLDGRQVTVQMQLHAVQLADGTPTGRAVGIITDITGSDQSAPASPEQTQQAIALREKVVYALSGDFFAVYVVDVSRNTVQTIRARDHLLPQVAKAAGRIAVFDTFLSGYVNSHTHVDDRESLLRELSLKNLRSRLQSEGVFLLRYRRYSGGQTEYVELKLADISQNHDGSQAVLAVRNIDSRIRQEMQQQEEVRAALAKAEESNRFKTQFLANVSHDLRTPLNAIVGFATIAENHLDDPARLKDCIGKIHSAGVHLQDLFEDILEMSRMQQGALTLREGPVSLCRMIDGLISVVQAHAESKNQQFYPSSHGLIHESVICDGLKLNQALLNILGNAVKFTPRGGSIWFRVAQSAGHKPGYARYIFTVQDTGVGISQEFLGRIYEPFQREAPSGTGSTEGTGLGITIAKRIVDAMGGQIQIQSQKGKGTTVTISVLLPTVESHSKWDKALPLVGKRVCLLGSDWEQMENLNTLLTALSVDVVPQGQKADAAIVVCDQRLEQRLRLVKDVPVRILCCPTGSEKPQGVEADGFCQEPIFLNNIRDALLNALGLAPEEAPVEEMPIPAGTRVLLVEDNALNQEIACTILEEAGFLVDTAANGQEAVERAEKSQPGTYQMILMDIQMPVMNGCEAAAAIRALNRPDLKSVPILAVTANAFQEDWERANESGMNDFITKPIDATLLLSKLHTWLAGARPDTP